ncbi:prenyltransferase-like protein [Aspergillus karnatakaensis]|uniref:prenyltransferase-like protein n=1 Tax=Aspergillus karnatakaensis TaxID=1810916 RepID=UPI003CCD48F9
MAIEPTPSAFSAERFLTDLEQACKALNVPYSEAATRQVLSTFHTSFHRGSVLWRTTDQPDGALNYRVYERQSVDMVSVARKAGLMPKESTLGDLIQSWANLYGEESQQLADFDSAKGLVKFWVFLGGVRPLSDLLNIPGVPNAIKTRQKQFESLGLTGVRHTAVDLEKNSMNIYFRTPGGLTRDLANQYLALAGADSVSDILWSDIRRNFPSSGGTFAVTMDFTTGKISRVAFYALRLHEDDMPAFNDRIQTFFDVCPSYDTEEMKASAWSFGKGNKSYVKAEHSHSGELVQMLKEWRTTMSAKQ